MKQLVIIFCVSAILLSCNENKPSKKQLEPIIKEVDHEIPPMYRGMVENKQNRLGGLNVGDLVSDFKAITSTGKEIQLFDELKKGALVLMFYRGHWCPKCTKHLAEIESQLALLKQQNIGVFAVTPESDKYIEKTIEKSKTSIPIIYDKDEKLMKFFKVYYKVANDYVDGLEKNHGQEEAFLPVPATYLIGSDKRIKYRHYDHDYSNRAKVADILMALEQ